MKTNHGCEYAAVWFLTKLAQILPGRVVDWMAFVLGRLAYAMLASRRRIARENLQRAFKNEKSPGEIEDIIKKVFLHAARTSVEFARQPVYTPKRIRSMYTCEGMEYLEAVRDYGKGAILISGHLGNWELLAGLIAAMNYPLDLLVGHQHNEKVNDLLISFRRSLGVGIIPVGVAARGVIKSLRSNRMVAIVSDQHAASGGVVAEFFSRPASTPKGPAAFAVKVDCPILGGVSVRLGYNRHHAVIKPPIYPPQTGDTEKDILIMTQAYTSLIEECIRHYPEQWLWTHRRWKID
ncbi:MAG: lysophospholipid acyltransferase family protein [candidate division Zixibacteria bacterium]|nr:lysophospholipid acyltransferase family protein [candidate division Zixibacteria bacterium]